jgi:hypothetical protein
MALEINKNNSNTSVELAPEVTLAEELSAPILETKSTDFIQPNNNIRGLSNIEMNDPNSINVTVADEDTPLIVLFGPPTCGKTMTLVRMTRYLKKEGYTVEPIRSFRPTSDTNYTDICESFDATINSNNAAESTDRISFLLVAVLKKGRPLCQILESPGEFYFDPAKPNAPFPNYVNTIIHSKNRKIWTMMIEPDWLDHTDRMNYVTRITNLTKDMKPKDKIVFLFNKIDKSNVRINFSHINVNEAIRAVQNWYPNIFVPFLNQNPITKLWKKHNCNFVPFQTGTYTDAINGKKFQEGPQEYCEHLWSVLMKRIYG